MGKRTRVRSKIGSLPPELRTSVEQMIMIPQEYTYQDISEFLMEHGYEISYGAVFRYARRINADLQMAVMNQENLRRITEAMNKYPDLDYVEVLMVIAAQKLMERIMAAPEDQWDAMEIEDVVKGVVSLARTKTYKRRTDSVLRSKEESGMQAALDRLFDALGREHPDLYNKVYDVAKKQLDAVADTEKALEAGGAS
jgi:virulence-associated protein VapD